MNRFDSVYTVDLTSVISNYKSLLITTFWIYRVSVRHLRPWYAKHKMYVDDSSQKIGWNMYLQGTDMQ